MKLVYYKSEKGIFVAAGTFGYGNKRTFLPVSGIRINGKDLEETHHPAWYFVEGEEEIISYKVRCKGASVNFRYELKEGVVAPEGFDLPNVLTLEEAGEWYDEDGYYRFGNSSKYKLFSQCYVRVSDKEADYYEEVDFEAECLGEIQSEWTNNPINDRFSVYKSQWKHEGDLEVDLKNIACYSEIEQMLTSDLLIHNRPCYISSKTTYNIIRKYVSDNIDSRWAVITSDYDFCFTVKKKISVKPYIKKTEILTSKGKSYSRPKFKTQNVTHKTVEIFEMTHKGRNGNYRGYTPIEGFKGDNLQDLSNNIKQYLYELMDYINCPLSECEHCKGTGHLFEDTFHVNKR